MSMKNAYILMAASGFIFLASLFSSGANAEWRTIKDEFIKDGKNKSAEKRIAATIRLAENITSEVEPEAAGLLISQIVDELARNKNGKK